MLFDNLLLMNLEMIELCVQVLLEIKIGLTRHLFREVSFLVQFFFLKSFYKMLDVGFIEYSNLN